MKEENRFVLNLKKSDMTAKNSYQYHKLENAGFYFVPCSITETYDELEAVFQMEGLRPFSEARKMRNADKYGFLIQILEAIDSGKEYSFSLNPENLYLNPQNRVCILNRDISSKTEEEKKNQWMDMQALAGYLLQRQYRYEDLRKGGFTLLKKQKRLKYILELEEPGQAREIFQQYQEAEREKDREELSLVNKHRYRSCLVIMCIAAAGCIAMTALLVYQKYWIEKPLRGALMAERAYMESDYTRVADALAGIGVEQMDRHEKYLLAVVYIRGQSVDAFNRYTKERLIAKLSYHGEEQQLDYWIHLGRMDADQALDVAMRMSDSQLMLYAYLQKLDMVSADSSLTGEEKTQQIESLKGKIKSLADELGIEYKDK